MGVRDARNIHQQRPEAGRIAECHRVRHWMMLAYVLNIVFWLREDPSLFNWLLGAWIALLWAEEVTYLGTTHRIPAR